MDTWDAVVAVAEPSELGEGPWWDTEGERLLWVDIPRGIVRAHTPATRAVSARRLGDPVGFVVARATGGYLAGTAAGLIALGDDLCPLDVVSTPADLDGQRRVNDGACDPVGRVLFGTVDPSGARTGTLWSLSPDGALSPVVKHVGMSNGLGFSLDGRRLYFVDTPTQHLDSFSYDLATGRVSDRTTLCEVPPDVGLPDGLAVDEEGCLWLAIWGAGSVWRLAPDGELIGVVRAAASRTSSCAFGGARLDKLFVTTADSGGHEPKGDHDGALFVADVGVRGASVFAARV